MSVRIEPLSMGLRAELQIVCADAGIPEKADFNYWLESCFKEEASQSVLIRIVEAAESADLNQQYRHRSGPTNILSFPFQAPPGIPNDHLGDLVICASLVSSEALEQGKPVMHHWGHLLIHGVLHLQGFDHILLEEAREMELMEVDLLARLKMPDPYGSERAS